MCGGECELSIQLGIFEVRLGARPINVILGGIRLSFVLSGDIQWQLTPIGRSQKSLRICHDSVMKFGNSRLY